MAIGKLPKELLQAGTLFSRQIKRHHLPHDYEGLIYEGSGGGIYMFCQVGFHKFSFILLQEGNRANDPVQLEHPHRNLSGLTPEETLAKMESDMAEVLVYKGTFSQLINGEK